MSTTIKYTTDLSSELTESQLSLVKEYQKKIFENNVLKKVEFYENNVLSQSHYYLINQSEISTVLLNDPNAQIMIREVTINHTIIKSFLYEEGVLIKKSVLIKNENDKIICMSDYDVSTDSPIYFKTFKTLYDENGAQLYEFEYNESGLCIHIHNLQEVQADIFPADIGVDPDIEFTWTGNEYYQFAYPIIPGN